MPILTNYTARGFQVKPLQISDSQMYLTATMETSDDISRHILNVKSPPFVI